MRKTITTVLVIAVLISSRLSAAGEENQPSNSGVIARAISRAVAEQARTQVPLISAPAARRQVPRLMPILIGAGVGATLLGLVAHRLCEGSSCGGDIAKGMLYGAGWGAAIGGLISIR